MSSQTPPSLTGLAKTASLILVALGTASAAAGFHRGFAWSALAAPLACAAVLPVAAHAALETGRVKGLRRRVPFAGLLVSTLLWLVVGAAVLFHGSVRAAAPWEPVSGLVRATVDGWSALLDVTLPAPGDPILLAVPFTLTWIAVAIGATAATRTRWPLAPALPAVGLFAFALAVTVPGQGSDTVPAIGVAAQVLLLAASGSRGEEHRILTSRHDGPLRGLARGAAILAALAVILGAVGAVADLLPGLASRDPLDPRRYQPVQFADDYQYDLLQQAAAWQAEPATPLFTVRTQTRATYVRLAVLDTYDGRTWTSSSRFSPAGGAVPQASVRAASGTVSESITVQGLRGYYLPEAGRPVRVGGTDLAVDLGTGTLASRSALTSGEVYTVVSSPALPDATTIVPLPTAATVPDAAAEPIAASDVPASVSGLNTLSAEDAQGPGGFGRDLLYLQSYLPRHYGVDSRAPGGTSLADLEAVLSGREPADTAQLAAVFALAVRSNGVPARLVVGFQLGKPTKAGYQVDAGDVTVWPEVEFAGIGWVPFHLVGPQKDSAPPPPPGKPGTGSGSQGGSTFTTPSPSTPNASSTGSGTTAPWLGYLGLAAAIACCGYLLVMAGGPLALRGLSRHRGGADRRVVAAWRDVVHCVSSTGTAIPPSATSSRIVRLVLAAARRDARSEDPLTGRLRRLGGQVDAIAFDGYATTKREAREAWRTAGDIRRAIRRATPWPRRIRSLLAPRRVFRARGRDQRRG